IGGTLHRDMAMHLAAAIEESPGVGQLRAAHDADLDAGAAQNQRADETFVAGTVAVSNDSRWLVERLRGPWKGLSEEPPRRADQDPNLRRIHSDECVDVVVRPHGVARRGVYASRLNTHLQFADLS